MSTMLLPKRICSRMDSMCRKFMWGSPAHKQHNLVLKSWSDICQPLQYGGLGCRLMHQQNVALVSKLCWKMAINDDQMWIKLLSEKYLANPNVEFLQYHLKSSDSLVWKGIVYCRNIITAGLCWQVGDGGKIRIWEVPWIPTLANFKPHAKNIGANTRAATYVHELISEEPRRWNEQMLNSMFDAQTVKAIQLIPLGQRSTHDRIIWSIDTSGIFTVKSAYLYYKEGRFSYLNDMVAADWEDLWKIKIAARLKFLLWKIASGILPTKSVIAKRINLQNNEQLCVFCMQKEETDAHIFLQCPIAMQLWSKTRWMHCVICSNEQISKWVHYICKPSLVLAGQEDLWHQFQISALIVMDVLWFTRNKIIHESQQVNLTAMESLMRKLITEHHGVWKKVNEFGQKTRKGVWNPMPGMVKINFDVAVRSDYAVAAAIGRDWQGKIVGNWVRKIVTIDPLVGECMAAELAVNLARSIGACSIRLEGDAAIIIDAIKNPAHLKFWKISSIIESIVVGLRSFSGWSARHIPRSENALAHDLAKKAAFSFSENCFPSFRLVENDTWSCYDFYPP